MREGGWLSIVVQLAGEIHQGTRVWKLSFDKKSFFENHGLSSNCRLMSPGLDFSGDNDITWLPEHQLPTIPPSQQVSQDHPCNCAPMSRLFVVLPPIKICLALVHHKSSKDVPIFFAFSVNRKLWMQTIANLARILTIFVCFLQSLPYNRFLNSQFKTTNLIKIWRNSGSLLLRIWLEFSQSPDFVVLQFKMIYFIIRKNIFSHLDLALVAVAIFRAYAGVSTKNITLLNITHTF